MSFTLMETACPHCGRRQEVQTGAPDNAEQAPTEGAISICWKCVKLAVFVADGDRLVLQIPPPELMDKLLASPQIAASMEAVARALTPQQAIQGMRRTAG